MTQVDALKSGIKTAVSTFLTGLLLVVSQIFSALQSALSDGNPPDLAFAKGALYSLVVALVYGVLNTIYRWLQVAGVPIFGALFDKLLGQVPKYLPPDTNLIDDIGEPPRDRGQFAGDGVVWTIVGILVIVVLIVWLTGRN